MRLFEVEVTREGGWWTVHVNALGGSVRARFPREVEQTARQYIAAQIGAPLEDVTVKWCRCPL